MLWYYEDDGIIGSDSYIKYDAEVMDSFTDALCRDIDSYRERARDLERGYVKYHNNETFVGEMADRSKEFTYDVQGDIHEKNLELKKEFLNMCLSIENKFKEEVDPSPKARVSVEGLTKIKKDFNVYLNALDAKGYELECHAKEAADILGRWGVSSVPTYRRAMEVCDEFCGQGKSLDKDIKKLESFDQEACAIIDRKDLTGYANDLQRKIKYTAGILDSMTVYQPDVPQNSIGLTAISANALYFDRAYASIWAATMNKSKSVKIFASDKEAAEYLDSQMKILCDGNDSNDAGAIANINATLQGFLYEKVVDGKKYVAYDQVKIQRTLMHLEKNGLAHQLLVSVNKQINVNKINHVTAPDAVTKLGIGGRFENTKLEVSKYGPGVKLEVTSNNDILPLNEIDHKLVAYAATKASSEHYFCNKDGSLNWDNVTEWIKRDSIDETSYEYDYFSAKMMDMSDEDVEKLLNLGMVASTDGQPNIVEWTSDYYGSKKYAESQNIQVTARRYAEIMNVVRNREGYNYLSLSDRAYVDDNENRSLAFLEATKSMANSGGMNMVADIKTEGSYGEKVYHVQINAIPGSGNGISESEAIVDSYETFEKTRNITVYPRASTDVIDKYLDDQAKIHMGKDVKFIYSHNLKDVDYEKILAQTLEVASEHAPAPAQICMKGVDVVSLGKEMAQDYKNSVEASTAMKGLDTGNGAVCMGVEGTVIYNVGGTSGSVIINDIEYDERELMLRSGAYDIATGADITVDELKEHYVNGDAEYQKYYDWYYSHNSKEQQNTYEDVVRYMLAQNNISLEDATDTQLNEAMQQVSEAIKATETNELRNVDLQEIEKWIQENGT